jgi:ParB family chromosome partitioning protein
VTKAPSQAINSSQFVEISIADIKVARRLRATSEEKILELAASIRQLGVLLHPITVSEKDGRYLLLGGNHRLEAMKHLGFETIPALINKEGDELIEQLVECQENLVRADLNAIQTAEHIIKQEELLSALGQRASRGDNRWKKSGLTTDELAKSMGVTKRAYQYKKSVSNLHPEVKDLLCETIFSHNLMDMVSLAKENDDIQLEVANLLITGQAKTFKRALDLARCKLLGFDWDEEKVAIKERYGQPSSVMKFDGDNHSLGRLCKLLSHNDDTRKVHRSAGSNEFQLYSTHPDHAAYFIDFYSKQGDLMLDCFAGRGTNLLVGAALGRKVVGYDLTLQNLQKVRSVALEHTSIDPDDLVLHHSDGCDLKEYEDQQDLFDLISLDPPYAAGAERYTDDPRCLGNMRSLDMFYSRLETCLINLKRLIKPSNWEERIFHAIVIKCGSSRHGKEGLIEMSTAVEILAAKHSLVLHDKVINVLNSQWGLFNVRRCMENKYGVKKHETTLVFLKYD